VKNGFRFVLSFLPLGFLGAGRMDPVCPEVAVALALLQLEAPTATADPVSPDRTPFLDDARAIDARALARYGWKLCQGSCGMVCASHGGGLRWMLLGPGDRPIGSASESPEPPPRRGYWESRTVNCGPFGQQRPNGRFTKTIEVWVEDSSEKTQQQPGPDPSASPRQQPGASRPAAAFSCPGGVCPGGT
jgi:hypothetical protein